MKQKILYLECFSGISGDMSVAALLDLGADAEVLQNTLASLPLEGYETVISDVVKSGLVMKDFLVSLDENHENHDHDMAYLHGHSHDHDHGHDHSHCHDHDHAHDHSHCHDHAHPHVHRGLPEIFEILEAGDLTPGALGLAKKIFTILAQAEGKVHGKPMEQVHFHEVGAVDSIVDIAAVAICVDQLGIDQVVVSPLYEGQGTIRCQHGILPIPVPATSAVVAAHGLKLHMTKVEGELVTPTGAAVAAALQTMEELPEAYTLLATGMGAGKRHYHGAPGFLRAMLMEAEQDTLQTRTYEDIVWKLESNIDDCTGENLGYLMELLLKNGARDVNYMPVYMKKNRPAYQLNVICDEEKRAELEEIIFRESTTIGIRRMQMERTVMDRSYEQLETPWGKAGVKICTIGEIRKVYPEYEDAKRIASESGISLQEVYRVIKNCGR